MPLGSRGSSLASVVPRYKPAAFSREHLASFKQRSASANDAPTMGEILLPGSGTEVLLARVTVVVAVETEAMDVVD
jgi:hypothetical protein